ncbi:molybdopterin cofactor [Colletotrichum plurivorum]|uniref:Molybdopterin cofactor n=1 Tax=Colletotrichum plurivorum TaxID=2175906 RepID=A0A8H6NQA6_9PEZI|nr:molybdopterin cofactor [Colletotrichum plurivorum]
MLLSLFDSLIDALGAFPATKLIIALILLPALIAIAILQYGTISTIRRALRNLQKQGGSVSNMADQFDPIHAIPESSATTTGEPIRIKSIFIHPVKSCGAIELPRALLTKSGFQYDRSFAIATEVVDDPATGEVSWRFISQRTKPSMCHIKTELYLPRDGADDTQDPLVRSGGCVLLSFADPDPPSWINRIETLLHTRDPSAKPQVHLIAPLSPPPPSHPLKTFGIHARQARGIDLSPLPSVAAALPKLKRYLNIPESRGLTLIRCTEDTLTRTDRNLAPLRHIGTPSVHGYTDQQPVNINSLSSVHAVSALLPAENQPLDALRFRANLWITGAPAFAEESWKRCRILPKSSSNRAAVAPKLSVVCRTSRCTMPNVNLETGTFDADAPPPGKKKGRPQPSATLVEHRTVEDGNPSALGYIGVHCVPEDQDLEEAREQRAGLYVEVGDEIEVLEIGVHLFGSTGNDY